MGFLEENKHWAPGVLRIFLGVGFLVAGLDKLLSMEAAKGFFQMMFGTSLGAPLLYLVIVVELLGGLALLFGWKVRLASSVLALMILVAFIKTFKLGEYSNVIGMLREIMVMNTGGGNTAVNFAYFAGLLSLAFSGTPPPKKVLAMVPTPKKASKSAKTKRKR